MKKTFEDLSSKAKPPPLLKDQELLHLTLAAAANEKSATLILLDCLVEVDVRKLYCTVNAYSSLFEYCVKELALSEPAAAERVNAVRLMKSVPEVKSHLAEGRLTLTSAAQIQRFVRTEEKISIKNKIAKPSVHTKKTWVDACLDQSKREVERTLFSKQSEPARQLDHERIKWMGPDQNEIRFIAEDKTVQKINRVKELLGEKSLEAIFDQALGLLIAKEEIKRGMNQPATKTETTRTTQLKKTAKLLTEEQPVEKQPIEKQPIEKQLAAELPTSEIPNLKLSNPHSKSTDSRYISIELKRAVFQRSQGTCEYIHAKTGSRCQSKYRLNIDHVYPFALGGKTEFKNLRHLCFQHNQRAAMNWSLTQERTPTTNWH
jgi:hypothetical protein